MNNYKSNTNNKINVFSISQETFVRLMLFCCGVIVTAAALLNLFHTNAGVDYTSEITYQDNQVVAPQELDITELKPKSTQLSTDINSSKTTAISKGTTFVNLLIKQGLNPQDIRQIQLLPQVHNYLYSVQAGQKLEITTTSAHHFNTLKYYLTPQKVLVIKNNKQRLISELIDGETVAKVHSTSLTITSSIAASIKKAGLSNKLAHELNQILSNAVNLSHEIQKGAHLNILYEAFYKNGKFDHIGNIFGIKLINAKKSSFVLRNVDSMGEVNYYDLEGKSLKPAFLRAPLHYRSISSPFNLRRMHPILRYVRPHTGVDLSAPSGTPIVAAGDGKITFVGSEGGYGRVIKIQNSPQYSTIYAHLSHFTKNLKRGMFVQKGQVIGYVGRTGLADGPHLHYEFRINGKPVNPMTVKLPQSRAIAKSRRAQYIIYANQIAHNYLST